MSQTNSSPQLDIVKQSLHDLGYYEPNGAVIHNYEFITNNGQLGYADLIAFGDTQLYDIDTACIVVNQWHNGHSKISAIKDITYIGAPIALFVLPDHIEIWPVNTKIENVFPQQKIVSYEDLPQYLSSQGRELSPKSLLNAKKGGRQLSLFDIDPSLTEFAREATQEALVRQFELAIQSTDLEVRKKFPVALNRLAVWVLAARILQDKLVNYDELKTADAMTLLKAVQHLFPNYFTTLNQDLELAGARSAYQLYHALSGDFTFRSLTNDMLAYFYENTLVNEEMRKTFGIYYTPRDIAQRILHRLPVEDFSPENRTVLDGTCGSGNLLLSAYDRLSSLLPAKWFPEQKHGYLLNHIWGIDQDSFACEIARMSLLLYNLPAGDSWQIKAADVFQVKPQQMFGRRPNIIVGNPPFEESLDRDTRNKTQKAAKVVDRYLDWLTPDGLLGIVLPLTFLHNVSARDTRERLLKQCDILEIWHLPEGSIPSSSAATAVILARKLSPGRENKPKLLTRINEEPGNSHRHELPMISYLIPQERWLSNPQWQMTSSPLDLIWIRIEKDLASIDPFYCEIWNGIKLGKKARSTHVSNQYQGPGWRSALINNLGGKTLEPFQINWQKTRYIRYPSDELERQRNVKHFDVPRKVITNATRNPNNPWRFYAAIDSERLIVTENFNYVLSKAATCEELVAIFNSMLANAWFSSRTYHRDVTLKDRLKKLPFPNFNSQQKQKIQELVHGIGEMKQSSYAKASDIRKYIDELDELVFDAYELDQKERHSIRAWMSQFSRPGKEWINSHPSISETTPYRGKYWTLTGQIEAIDPDHQTITVSVEGRENAIEINIPATMPGWALRPGVTFQAITPWDQRYPSDLSEVNWLDFQPLDYSYFTDDELASHLSTLESHQNHG